MPIEAPYPCYCYIIILLWCFLVLLFQRLQNTCRFYYLSLQVFCHPPTETKILNVFLPGYRWKNVKQYRTRADFHRASLETHPCDDESSLPVAFGDLSVSQLLIHYKYVMLIVYHLFFFLFELSGSTKSKAIKDYITLALILLSIDIKLVWQNLFSMNCFNRNWLYCGSIIV